MRFNSRGHGQTHTTLKQWPIGLSLMDMAWGTCLSAAAAADGKALMDWAAPL